MAPIGMKRYKLSKKLNELNQKHGVYDSYKNTHKQGDDNYL